MFAVIRTGGKQYRVAEEDTLTVGRLAGEPGEIVTLGEVLMVGGEGQDASVGVPLVEGASVAAEIVRQGRAKTVIAFKKRRRQNSRRKRGQRQHETVLRITEILTAGAKPSRRPAARAQTAVDAADAGISAAPVADAAPAPAAAEAAAPAKPARARGGKGAAEATAPAPDAAASAAAAPLFTAPEGEADDLVVINGIGPVAARQLKEQGITTFAQLAALSEDDIARIDAHMPFSSAQIRHWQEEARTLAKK